MNIAKMRFGLPLLAWLGFGAALYSYFVTRIEAMRPLLINSDSLYVAALFDDLTRGGSLWNWRLPPGNYFFPDILLYGLLRLLTGNPIASLYLFGIVQLFLFLIGLLLLGKKLIPALDAARHALLVAMGTLYLTFSAQFETFTLAKLTVINHFAVLLVVPYLFVLLIELLEQNRAERRRRAAGVLFVLLILLMTASDSFFVIQVAAPLSLALLPFYRINQVSRRRLLEAHGLLVFGTLAGFGIGRLIHSQFPILGRYIRFSNAPAALHVFITEVGSRLTRFPWQTALQVVFYGACLLIVLSAARRLAARQPIARPAMFLFAFFCLIVLLLLDPLTIIMAGIFTDVGALRYLLPILVLPAFWALPLVLTFLHSSQPGVRLALAAATCLVSLWALVLMAGDLNKSSRLEALANYRPALVSCMDANAGRYNLHNGIATYWTARMVSALSHNQLNLAQVYFNFWPYEWMNNKLENERTPDFVLIDLSLPVGDLLRIEEPFVRSQFGEPAAVFSCEGALVLVYNRPTDTAIHQVFQQYLRETNGER